MTASPIETVFAILSLDAVVSRNTKGPVREHWASARNGPRKTVSLERLLHRLLNRVDVSSDQIVHRLAMCAFDLNVLPRPKRMLFHFLQKTTAPGAPHLDPADVVISTVSKLLGEQKHGSLASSE
jgi:hypothetical protein